MSEVRGLRVSASAALKEKRLLALLKGRDPAEPALEEAIEDAQLLGSLELSGLRVTWDEVVASRRSSGPEPIRCLRRARAAVDATAPLTLDALRAWHSALFGAEAGWRSRARAREGRAPAPPELIPGRLSIFEEWINSERPRHLKPAP